MIRFDYLSLCKKGNRRKKNAMAMVIMSKCGLRIVRKFRKKSAKRKSMMNNIHTLITGVHS